MSIHAPYISYYIRWPYLLLLPSCPSESSHNDSPKSTYSNAPSTRDSRLFGAVLVFSEPSLWFHAGYGNAGNLSERAHKTHKQAHGRNEWGLGDDRVENGALSRNYHLRSCDIHQPNGYETQYSGRTPTHIFSAIFTCTCKLLHEFHSSGFAPQPHKYAAKICTSNQYLNRSLLSPRSLCFLFVFVFFVHVSWFGLCCVLPRPPPARPASFALSGVSYEFARKIVPVLWTWMPCDDGDDVGLLMVVQTMRVACVIEWIQSGGAAVNICWQRCVVVPFLCVTKNDWDVCNSIMKLNLIATLCKHVFRMSGVFVWY